MAKPLVSSLARPAPIVVLHSRAVNKNLIPGRRSTVGGLETTPCRLPAHLLHLAESIISLLHVGLAIRSLASRAPFISPALLAGPDPHPLPLHAPSGFRITRHRLYSLYAETDCIINEREVFVLKDIQANTLKETVGTSQSVGFTPTVVQPSLIPSHDVLPCPPSPTSSAWWRPQQQWHTSTSADAGNPPFSVGQASNTRGPTSS